MTPEQALDMLDRMVAMTPASRFDHAAAQQAVQVLRHVVYIATVGEDEKDDGDNPDA